MADQIQVAYSTAAANLYAVVRNTAGQAYRADTQVFEAYSTANLTSTKYAVALTEQGTASRYYTAAFPGTIAAGVYFVAVYLRAGANPAETDTLLTGGSVDWDGTNIVSLSSRSTYAGADTAGTTTLLSRVTGAVPLAADYSTARAAKLDNLDAAVTTRLAPTTAGRTLDVSSTGEAGLDFDNIKDATGAHTLTNIRVPNVTLTDTVTTYTGNTLQTGDSYAKVNDGTFGLAAIKGYVDDIGVAGAGLTALGDTRLANLDATVSSRLATSEYTAPDNATITAIAGYVDTEVAAIKVVTDHLATALELNTGNYRFTVAALANAPGLDAASVRSAVGLASANLDTQLSVIAGYVDTVESRLPAALVGGRMDSSVGAMAADTLTASALATSAVAEIQSGLSTITASDVWADASRTLTAFGFNVTLATSQPNYAPSLAGDAMTLADGAITEAKIAVPAETAGRPTGVLGMVRRIFEWMSNKRTRNRTSGDVALRNAADNATLETQTQSTVSDVDTQTKGV